MVGFLGYAQVLAEESALANVRKHLNDSVCPPNNCVALRSAWAPSLPAGCRPEAGQGARPQPLCASLAHRSLASLPSFLPSFTTLERYCLD